MSSIKVSSFYGKKSITHNNVQVVFVPDFDKSECSGVETESDDDIPLVSLTSTTAMHPPVIETESESIIKSDSEDDQAIANIPTKIANKYHLTDQSQTNKVIKGVPSRWQKRPPHFVNPSFTGKPFPNTPEQALSLRRYFDMFFDESRYDIIVDQTNLYSTQTTGRSIDTTNLEIEQFIGILLTMGILKYSQYRMYWSQYTKCVMISETMALK